MNRQFFLAGLTAFMVGGCKLYQQEPVAQQKIDDSNTRKTVEQQKQEKTGSPGTKLFNITRLLEKDGDTRIAIPIAISMEIKKRNILEKIGNEINFYVGRGRRFPRDTKIIAHIKDLRHDHSKTSAQKITLTYEGSAYYGKNKYGSYTIEFHKPSQEFPEEIGTLRYGSKKTGGSYVAPLVQPKASVHSPLPFATDWKQALAISEHMFRLMQGKNKSPHLPSDSMFIPSDSMFKKCLDSNLLTQQKEGKIIYYQQGTRFSGDNKASFRIYGLNALLARGVQNADSLSCELSTNDGLSYLSFRNTDGHGGSPPSTKGSSSKRVMSLYLSDRVKQLPSDYYYNTVAVTQDSYFMLHWRASRVRPE